MFSFHLTLSRNTLLHSHCRSMLTHGHWLNQPRSIILFTSFYIFDFILVGFRHPTLPHFPFTLDWTFFLLLLLLEPIFDEPNENQRHNLHCVHCLNEFSIQYEDKLDWFGVFRSHRLHSIMCGQSELEGGWEGRKMKKKSRHSRKSSGTECVGYAY